MCPKKGINPTVLLWGWDWDHQSYSREGSGCLGIGKKSFQLEIFNSWKKSQLEDLKAWNGLNLSQDDFFGEDHPLVCEFYMSKKIRTDQSGKMRSDFLRKRWIFFDFPKTN